MITSSVGNVTGKVTGNVTEKVSSNLPCDVFEGKFLNLLGG